MEMNSIDLMNWISATDWYGDNFSLLWASDGQEIFQARYQESDFCEVPEERLFIKLTEKVWLPVLYIWTGQEKPAVLPANILSVIKNFSLPELLRSRFPELDRKSVQSLYTKLRGKLPRLPNLNMLMEEALFFTSELSESQKQRSFSR